MSAFEEYTKKPEIPAGRILYNIIAEKNFTQAYVAQAAGITPQRLNDMIMGKRRFTLERSMALEEVLCIDIPGFFYICQAHNDVFEANNPLKPVESIGTLKICRIIIAGSRSFNDYDRLCRVCDHYINHVLIKKDIVIVSGTANGADALGERYAIERGYAIERFPAQWQRYGKSAGIIRNSQMADKADLLLAFWNGISPGTASMIKIAQRKNLQVKVIKV